MKEMRRYEKPKIDMNTHKEGEGEGERRETQGIEETWRRKLAN